MYMYAQVQWCLPPLSHMRAFKMGKEGRGGVTARYFIFIASFRISQFHESIHVLHMLCDISNVDLFIIGIITQKLFSNE
jgi:hypothetical protein